MFFTYDNRQNLTKKEKTEGGAAESTTYEYDKNNRLTEERTLSGGKERITSYGYDANGNLTYRVHSELESASDTTPGLGLSKDAEALVEMYAYDGLNRLTRAMKGGQTAEYTYDGNNLRQSKTVDGVTTTHIWDGQNMAAEKAGGETTVYIRGLSLVTRKGADGGKSYYHFNTHGDTAALTDANGTITADYRYDAYGNPLTEITDPNPFRYAGEYTDDETGFLYLRNRYYEPATGRFVTEDPVRDGLNWYAYCAGNPIAFIDPWGLDRAYVNVYEVDQVMLRYSAEDNGYTVTWNEQTKTATVTNKQGDVVATYTEGVNAKRVGGRLVVDAQGLADSLNVDKRFVINKDHKYFQSAEDAAIAWSLVYGEKSQQNGEEYGAKIVQDKYGFYYTETYTDHNKNGVVIEGLGWNGVVAAVHTHPLVFGVSDNGEGFSVPYDGLLNDTGMADKYGITLFLLTPTGKLKSYSEKSGVQLVAEGLSIDRNITY